MTPPLSPRPDLDAAVAGDGLTAEFQPIVSLPDGATVGFEALARWSHLRATPVDDVIAHAARIGRADELERRCIEAAIVGALDAGLVPRTAVFINCEPTTPYLSPHDSEVLARGAERFKIVFEITERRLLANLPGLLRKVVALREDGFALALDDVGTDMNSLALLDVLAPDVIKLDLSLVHSLTRYQQARTWAAVLAHHERAGAHVLAEGVETAEHLRRALALGATLGQGFRFGRSGPLGLGPDNPVGVPSPPIRTQRPCVDAGSPFDVVATHSLVSRQRKDTMVALSRYLEQQALDAEDSPMVLTALQSARFFTGECRARHQRLAAQSPLVAVFGRDVKDNLGCGIRGVRFARGDPLESQWIVLALGANLAAALVSREVLGLRSNGSDGDRRFDVTMTHDRNLVTRVARQLLSRMLTPHEDLPPQRWTAAG